MTLKKGEKRDKKEGIKINQFLLKKFPYRDQIPFVTTANKKKDEM